MILFQLGIFAIILISSFFGIIPLLIATVCIILFTISNVFTLSLMAVQFTTILISLGIGAVIAIIVDLRKFSKTLVGSMGRARYTIFKLFKMNGFKEYYKTLKWSFIFYIIHIAINYFTPYYNNAFSIICLAIAIFGGFSDISSLKTSDRSTSYLVYYILTFLNVLVIQKSFFFIGYMSYFV